MSQTPESETTAQPIDGYLDAWEKLARMIQQGRSFSGHERNCCFLNTGGTRFADVSAATGLDLDDDGRSVALTDWDHDGDVDLWLANRTGPRLRFLRNDLPAAHHFLALRLIGDPRRRTNRDAIGARVELHLAGVEPGRLIRTLRAGDGFLSQSTKWLHFGVPRGATIERVVVRWPGGGRDAGEQIEEFRGLALDRRWVLEQGSGAARPQEPRRGVVALPAGARQAPPDTGAARVRFARPVEAPRLAYTRFDGNAATVTVGAGSPVLVNLWASWCRPCLEELRDITRASGRIRSKGLDVVALSVDGLEDDQQVDLAALERVIDRLGFPFRAGRATSELVAALDAIQRERTYRVRQLPVPTSFLVDGRGRIAIVYKGKVEVDRVLADAATLDGDDKTLERRAVPFEGRWADDHFVTNPIAVAGVYLEGRYPEDAREYLERYLGEQSDEDLDPRTRALRVADVHHMLGRVALLEGDTDEAARSFRRALEQNPDLAAALVDLARLLAERGDHAGAIELLERARRQSPRDPRIHYRLGSATIAQGDVAAGLRHLRQALAVAPGYPPAANDLAWILATHPDPTMRNGREAVDLARRLSEASRFRDPRALDTLAAALAEIGDFTRAAETARRAADTATTRGLDDLAVRIRDRVALFESGQPYREMPEGR